MQILLAKIITGAVVGLLVGLTGLGGGVLLVPILIFGLHVPPIIVVGSDAVFNCITKLGSGYLHWRNGNVNFSLLSALVTGSLPGSCIGLGLLIYLRNTFGTAVNSVIEVVVGLLLIIIPLLLLAQGPRKMNQHRTAASEPRFRLPVIAIGLIAGLLIGLTSIGSGTVTMMLLLLIYPQAPLLIIGTDIVHAVAVTGFTSILHLQVGNVNLPLVAALLAGSVPGALLGTKLSTHLPTHWLKRILCGVLLLTGARMLFV